MEISVDGELVRLRGDLDVCSARMVDRHAPSTIDVSGVTFIDCAGVAALVRARERALARGRRFALKGVRGPVAFVLEATRHDGILGP